MDVSTGAGCGLSEAQSRRLAEIEASGVTGWAAGELRALERQASGVDAARVAALLRRGRAEVDQQERRKRLHEHRCPTCGNSLRGGDS